MDDLTQLPPIRCVTCGKVLANKWEPYRQLLREGYTPEQALNHLGINRYCCRTRIISPSQLPLGVIFQPVVSTEGSIPASERSYSLTTPTTDRSFYERVYSAIARNPNNPELQEFAQYSDRNNLIDQFIKTQFHNAIETVKTRINPETGEFFTQEEARLYVLNNAYDRAGNFLGV